MMAFTPAEFIRRWDAVTRLLPEHDVDAIAVTAPLHEEYLTGTVGSQYWASPVILQPGQAPTHVVRLFDEARVRRQGAAPNLVAYFDRDEAIATWAGVLRSLGLDRTRLGLELDNEGLTHDDAAELQRLCPRLRIVDVSSVLPRVMAVKSAEEIAAMRASMDRTRAAIDAFNAGVRPGATSAGVFEEMRRAALSAGSPDLRGGCAFGPETSVPHPSAGAYRLRPGDAAVTETGGYESGYCAALCRTATLGEAPRVAALYSVVRDAQEAILLTVRPGVTTGVVDAAARSVIERAGQADLFRHRTGYANGLRANGRLNITLKPGGRDVIEEGMTFHTPIILVDPGGFAVQCSESILVTSGGAEALSGMSRDLVVA